LLSGDRQEHLFRAFRHATPHTPMLVSAGGKKSSVTHAGLVGSSAFAIAVSRATGKQQTRPGGW
jgi:hypothetical protein